VGPKSSGMFPSFGTWRRWA